MPADCIQEKSLDILSNQCNVPLNIRFSERTLGTVQQ